MRKTLAILSCYAVAHLLLVAAYSCNKPVNSCGGGSPKQTVHCASLQSISVQAKNTGNQTLDSLDYVTAKSLVLEVQLNGAAITCFRPSSVNPFISSAYACSPPPPALDFKGAIAEVQLFSNADYDATHPAGSNLAAYFENAYTKSLNTYEYNGSYSSTVTFMLSVAPQNEGVHKFTVVYKLTNGSELKSETVAVRLGKN